MKILAVCGMGLGTGLLLRMQAEKALRELGIQADVEVADIGTARALASSADLILTSEELAAAARQGEAEDRDDLELHRPPRDGRQAEGGHGLKENRTVSGGEGVESCPLGMRISRRFPNGPTELRHQLDREGHLRRPGIPRRPDDDDRADRVPQGRRRDRRRRPQGHPRLHHPGHRRQRRDRRPDPARRVDHRFLRGRGRRSHERGHHRHRQRASPTSPRTSPWRCSSA